LIHPSPPFIPIDLKIGEAMDGTTQAAGRAVELKRVSTEEAARGVNALNSPEDLDRFRGGPASSCKTSPGLGVNGMKPGE
jgi:hypothetical protein